MDWNVDIARLGLWGRLSVHRDRRCPFMEEEIIVSGNGVLEGEVRVSGAKNSALKLIAAAILGRGKTVLRNVPRISDIEIMSEVLAHLGADVERGADHSLSVDTSTVDKYETPYKLVSKMRASISVLGPSSGVSGKPCRYAGRLPNRRAQDRHAPRRARGVRRPLRQRPRCPSRDDAERPAWRPRDARVPERRRNGEHAHGGRGGERDDVHRERGARA